MAEITKNQPAKVGSVFDLPGKSIKIVKENWKLFALVNILSIISALFQLNNAKPWEDRNFSETFSSAGFGNYNENFTEILGGIAIVGLIVFILTFFLYAMATSLEIRTSNGEKPSFDAIFSDAKRFWLRQIALILVCGFIIVIGLFLLIVPGIIAISRLIMAPYVMFDKKLGIFDSIKASNELAKGNFVAIWSVLIVFILLSILLSALLGLIPFIGSLLGAIASIGISLMLVLRYRELQSKKSIIAKPATTQ